jgi:hypothetical protein
MRFCRTSEKHRKTQQPKQSHSSSTWARAPDPSPTIQAHRKLLLTMGLGPKVVLEPLPGRAFLLKSEWSVPRPEIPEIPKSRKRSEKRLGETAGGGEKSRSKFRLGPEVYHSKSYGPSYNIFCAMVTSICLPRAPEKRFSRALSFENW